MGEASLGLDAGVRAALQSDKSVSYVCPPAGWAVVPLFAALGDRDAPGIRVLVLAPELPDVLDVARALRPVSGFEPVVAVTGIARAGRLVASGGARTLVATPRDALRLLEMSRLAPVSLPTVAVLWPEFTMAAGEGELIDTLLAEAAPAQRLIVTSDPVASQDLLERHARRVPQGVGSQPREQPGGGVRYAIVDSERRVGAVRNILDSLNPASALLWEPSAADRFERWVEFAEDPGVIISDTPAEHPVDLTIAVELPSAEQLSTLQSSSRDVIVLIRASQLSYLMRLAKPARAMRLTNQADRARERAHSLRQAIRTRLEDEDVLNDLLALAPLFDEYDPALVAAALARGAATPTATESTIAAAWVRIQVSLGKRDHVRPADLVGALLHGVGLPKDHVGKVEIRDGFSIVEIRAEDAQRALRGLAGLSVRGKTAGARIAN